MIKRLLVTCILLFLAFAILPRITLAQSSAAIESRLARVESDNLQLRSQITNLESQVAGLRGVSSPQTTVPARPQAPPVPPRTNRQVTSSDPMFERLATLVIELKQRVQVLETQVIQLRRQR